MKYMGSKARLVKDLLPILIKDQGSCAYYEPFAGGMNMIQHVPPHFSRHANDNNRFLIAFWKEFLSGWRPPEMTRELYYECKAGRCSDALRGWAGFNCSYSGKWFGGYAGSVKTKSGKFRDYIAEALSNCEKQVALLEGVNFTSKHYEEITFLPNSVIYCDPPYEGTTGYHSNFDHLKFWGWVRKISSTNRVFVSEYSAPEDFDCIWQKSVTSSLSANGKSGASLNSIEKLFIYKL